MPSPSNTSRPCSACSSSWMPNGPYRFIKPRRLFEGQSPGANSVSSNIVSGSSTVSPTSARTVALRASAASRMVMHARSLMSCVSQKLCAAGKTRNHNRRRFEFQVCHLNRLLQILIHAQLYDASCRRLRVCQPRGAGEEEDTHAKLAPAPHGNRRPPSSNSFPTMATDAPFVLVRAPPPVISSLMAVCVCDPLVTVCVRPCPLTERRHSKVCRRRPRLPLPRSVQWPPRHTRV